MGAPVRRHFMNLFFRLVIPLQYVCLTCICGISTQWAVEAYHYLGSTWCSMNNANISSLPFQIYSMLSANLPAHTLTHKRKLRGDSSMCRMCSSSALAYTNMLDVAKK